MELRVRTHKHHHPPTIQIDTHFLHVTKWLLYDSHFGKFRTCQLHQKCHKYYTIYFVTFIWKSTCFSHLLFSFVLSLYLFAFCKINNEIGRMVHELNSEYVILNASSVKNNVYSCRKIYIIFSLPQWTRGKSFGCVHFVESDNY